MFWTCARCGRRIGDDEWTSMGDSEGEHICEDRLFASMGAVE